MREIVLDTETTGLYPAGGDRIVEIGCLELNNHIPTGRSFHSYVNPERMMPADAREVHGLTDAFLADKPVFAEVAAGLLEFLGDAPLVIHNAAFDLGFLDAEFARLDRPRFDAARAIDTVQLARRKFPGSPASLDALCRRFGIDAAQRIKHGALVDAELLAAVYLELVGGRQPALALAVESISAPAPGRARRDRPVRAHAPSPEEIEAHETLVADIPDAIWNGRRAQSSS